jgi:uncharacterized protein YoxC
MTFWLLMTLTVIEVLALVLVLWVYLVKLTRRLRSISLSLSRVAWGVRAVEVEVSAVGPAVTQANALLTELTDDLLPGVADKAARLAG